MRLVALAAFLFSGATAHAEEPVFILYPTGSIGGGLVASTSPTQLSWSGGLGTGFVTDQGGGLLFQAEVWGLAAKKFEFDDTLMVKLAFRILTPKGAITLFGGPSLMANEGERGGFGGASYGLHFPLGEYGLAEIRLYALGGKTAPGDTLVAAGLGLGIDLWVVRL